MRNRHRSNCPLCRHPQLVEIERLYGDWYSQKELIDMFDLVGEGKTYENESAAYRGILRHMTVRRTPLDRRAENCLGLLRCFARNGVDVMTKVEPEVMLSIAQKAAAKLGEIVHGTKQNVKGEVMLDVRTMSDQDLQALIRAAAANLPAEKPFCKGDSQGGPNGPDGQSTESSG